MMHKKFQFIELTTALDDNIPDVLYTSPVVSETKKGGLNIFNQINSSVEFNEYYYDNIKKGSINDWWNFISLSNIEKNHKHYNGDYHTIRLIKSKEIISSPYLNRVSFKNNEQSELIYSQKERR